MVLHRKGIMWYKIFYLLSLVILLTVRFYFTISFSLCVSSFHIEYARG